MNEQDIKKRLKQDTDFIVSRILEEMHPQPISIYLVGGQGRHEGSWYEDDNGMLNPYNDYDIAIISENIIEHRKCETLRRELAKAVNIRWVDLDFYHPSSLSNLTPTIHNVDLLEASCLLWGEPMLEKLPRLDKTQIGRNDIIIAYGTRMWTLLGSWKGEFHDLEAEEARFFKNQMAKCVLSACDMVLIKNKSYHTSYVKRSVLAPALYPSNLVFTEMAKWAINEKLRPSSGSISKDDMQGLYNKANSLFKWAFCEALGHESKLYSRPQNTYKTYMTFSHFIHFIYSLFKSRSFSYLKAPQIFLAQNYLLQAYNNGEINQQYVKCASKILERWGFGENLNWYDMHEIAANARNNI